MIKILKTTVVLGCLSLFNIAAYSSEPQLSDALTVDKVVTENIQLNFPNDNNIQPDRSDFEIVNYILLSNEQGKRAATITLINNAAGNRTLDNSQIMGLFANGVRSNPQRSNNKNRFKSKELQTITVSFGKSHYPLLKVYTRSK